MDAWPGSWTHRALHRGVRWLRASFGYRWLTADPDPEVIVIDLRDTYTAGPVIVAIDRVLDGLVRSYARSRLGSLIDRTTAAVLAAPIRVISVVLLGTAIGWLGVGFLTGLEPRTEAGPPLVVLGLSALGTRVTRPWADLRETRPIRLLATAFEPPEPIDQRSDPMGDGPESREGAEPESSDGAS